MVGTAVALINNSGLVAMEQIVKGAGKEKSEPCRSGTFAGRNSKASRPPAETHEVWMAPPNKPSTLPPMKSWEIYPHIDPPRYAGFIFL